VQPHPYENVKIRPFRPYIVYDFSEFITAPDSAIANEKKIEMDYFYNDMEDKLKKIFSCLFADDKEEIWVTSWQHELYSFNPDLPFELDEFDEWLEPALPNGDYSFFLTKDYKNGIFGDGINFRLAFFGDKILSCLSKNMPSLLQKSAFQLSEE
jgi:hypothetical protein